MENEKYITGYFDDMSKIISQLDREKIDNVINIFFNAWKNNKKIFAMGNGGSASTASHFVADLNKTAIVEGKKRFKAVSLVDNMPLMTAWVNDTSWDDVYTGQLENFIEEGDVLVGFSVHGASGWSGNMPKAMDFAKNKGALNVSFAGFDGGKMKEMADECVVVPIESTPQVEAFHVVLHHLIVFGLKEKIEMEG